MNAHVVQDSPDDVRRLISVDDLRRMIEAGIIDEDERVELLDGELIEMNAKKFAHEYLKSALVRRLIQSSSDDTFVGVEPSLRLDTHVMVEPDILVCRRRDVVPGPEGYVTVPGRSILLLVEIADSSLRKDRGRKAKLYARYAVPDYWIVDTNARVVWRHLEPAPGGYASIKKVAEDQELRPIAAELAKVALRLADLA